MWKSAVVLAAVVSIGTFVKGSASTFGDNSCIIFDEEGWKCNTTGTCIPRYWVCDSDSQCPHPDTSDEVQGCALFPETGCKSWYGRRHERCPNDASRCVEDLAECDVDTGSAGSSPSGCKNGPDFWRCDSGLCIHKNLTCNNIEECDDGSDERAGCLLFASSPESDGCLSWFGQPHVRCRAANDSLGTPTLSVCTLPQFADSGCRQCGDVNHWRCDNGFCIPVSKVQDGIKDCKDGSDEFNYKLKWWMILVGTFTLPAIGISLSFLHRLINRKKDFFSCSLCRSRRSAKLTTDFELRDAAAPLSELVSEAGEVLPKQLLRILEQTDNWRKRSLHGRPEAQGLHLYARVHQDPVLYRNLYRYVVYRFGRPSDLSRVVDQLLRFEQDLHGESKVEALACWRLHLGSSEILKQVVESVQPESLVSKFYNSYLPIKNLIRRARKSLPNSVKEPSENLYGAWNTLLYTLPPFLGASCFYFDVLKDCALATVLYSSLADLTRDNFSPNQNPFEMAVIFAMIAALVLTQLLFVAISVSYASEAFEICEHSSSALKQTVFRVLAVVFAPLMPAFILANHVFYQQRDYYLERELQTLDDSEDHGKDKLKDDEIDSEEREAARWLTVLGLFKEIEKARYRSQLHRRVYSFYRVVAAVVQSFSTLVCMLLVMIVTSREGRDVKLISGVIAKLADFLDLSQTETFLYSLDIAKDVVIGTALCYSLVMILTAFMRYVDQCKNNNLTMGGRVFLCLYFACFVAARLTLYIAMFTTAEATDKTKPTISLFPAAILGLIIFGIHFVIIYWFKFNYVDNFRHSGFWEGLVHTLANTVVVIPFIPVDGEHAEACCDEHVAVDDPRCPKRSVSLPERMASPAHKRVQSTLSDSTVFACPNVFAPLMVEVGNLHEFVEKLWWERPSRTLTLDEVRARLPKHFSAIGDDYVHDVFVTLEREGYINKRLFVPQRTKREYFWLLTIHFLVSGAALIVEVANGGTYTQQGLYYSWDVRLTFFFLGLLFLLLYYKKYHVLYDLRTVPCCQSYQLLPIVCCCKEEEPMQSIALQEDVRRHLRGPVYNPESGDTPDKSNSLPPAPSTVCVHTQTSVSGNNLPVELANGGHSTDV